MENLHLRTPNTKRLASHFKDMSDVQEEAAIIRETNPDILVLEEVYSLDSLDFFNQEHLDEEYDTYLVAGNDDGNFHIGFLVRKGLGFDIEVRSYRDRTWIDPVDGVEKRLFTRDVPALLFRRPNEQKVQFVVMGNHAKAPTYRNGDEQSIMLRSAQYKETTQIIRELQAELGANVPLIMAGDFNTDIHHSAETRDLLQIMMDSFDLLARPPPDAERITHTYHPKNGPTDYNQFDGILVSRNADIYIQTAQVYRYKDGRGRTLDVPDSRVQRDRQPSDHFPVFADIEIAIR